MPSILSANTLSSGYDVDNSVRFNVADNAKLSRSISGSPTDPDKFTISFWMKKTALANQVVFGNYANANFRSELSFSSDDRLQYFQVNDGSASFDVVLTRRFRDPSAWYHIVFVYDSGQGTDTNRFKFFVNGVHDTNYSHTSPYPAQDLDGRLNQASQTLVIGQDGNDAKDFNGYLAEVVLIDGQALDADQFGEFDSDTGIWKPIDVSGLTFGDDGFYLDFEDSGDLGDDESGNGNDFTESNLAATDQSTDTCTNNFATMNPLNIPASNAPTFTEGNLQVSSSTTGAGDFGGSSTIGVSSGKWFVETKVIDANQSAGQGNAIGISGEASGLLPPSHGSATNSSYCYKANGDKVINGTGSSYGATFTQNDIIGIALDLDSGTNTVTFYKNGASQGSIDIVSPSSTTDGFYFFTQGDTSTGNNTPSILSYNFGSPAFSISSGNADGNGHGNFEFEVPSGHFALNTKNLAEHG